MSEVRFVSNITKVYPDMIKIVIYHEPKMFTTNSGSKRNISEIDETRYIPSISSLNRTKTLVRDLVLCNHFELFCTFTFDPKKVNSFSFGRCYQKMSTWVHHQSDNSRMAGKEFKYLVIPEMHKSGRWHFHALISGYVGTLCDSKHLNSTGRRVYNITSFRSGFTTAVEIDDSAGVSNYVTKYITKDFIKRFNQRRFFCSRNLIRPEKYLNSSIPSRVLPLFKKHVSTNSICSEYLVLDSPKSF